jgi:hypothetical protein
MDKFTLDLIREGVLDKVKEDVSQLRNDLVSLQAQISNMYLFTTDKSVSNIGSLKSMSDKVTAISQKLSKLA